eukprot:CAMPEP_0115510658 /NCGR_PEP_ID=MMETSP0271-20121206/73540_1 /TAXON_ID=71861 /ORGANISM="Scrippsiella trochoidea, Strain CCMP3099" /LENGTH=159 /DNA_ID=CAMNT_0002940657 /DNA_START=425 /DNA_END=904 /DNA_ORIENTATION=-
MCGASWDDACPLMHMLRGIVLVQQLTGLGSKLAVTWLRHLRASVIGHSLPRESQVHPMAAPQLTLVANTLLRERFASVVRRVLVHVLLRPPPEFSLRLDGVAFTSCSLANLRMPLLDVRRAAIKTLPVIVDLVNAPRAIEDLQLCPRELMTSCILCLGG